MKFVSVWRENVFVPVHDYLVRAIPVKHRKRAEEGRQQNKK